MWSEEEAWVDAQQGDETLDDLWCPECGGAVNDEEVSCLCGWERDGDR